MKIIESDEHFALNKIKHNKFSLVCETPEGKVNSVYITANPNGSIQVEFVSASGNVKLVGHDEIRIQ